MIARKGKDLVTEGRCRFTQGYGAPFDTSQLVAAYELGLAAPSLLLAGASAAALASGGTDDQRDAWLQRADGVMGRLGCSTIKANYNLALADSLIERGMMQEALDLAVAAGFDTQGYAHHQAARHRSRLAGGDVPHRPRSPVPRLADDR